MLQFTLNVSIVAYPKPFGLHLFIIKAIAPKVSISDITKGCMVFGIADIFVLGLIMVFPQIALWLPNLMSGN
jgi:TRAP-type C4-dicarboxylate transport system permease large subunit